jgi:acetyl-CoA carboxylase biotin carboxyl carrier protein
MAGSSASQDIFDVRKIRRLVELMKEHDLSEMDLQQGEMRIQLRRDSEKLIAHSPAAASPPPPTIPAPAQQSSGEQAAADSDNLTVIKSPMVGTFYPSPDPDSTSYVKVGDHVGSETTVCIVEAMKVFNQIPAEISGKIIAVLVESGDPVEFGQPLFRVDTTQ